MTSAGTAGTAGTANGIELSRADRGLRLTLFVPPKMAAGVDAVAVSLPDQFAERPTRFAMSSGVTMRHRVGVADVGDFAHATLGVDARRELWSTTGSP